MKPNSGTIFFPIRNAMLTSPAQVHLFCLSPKKNIGLIVLLIFSYDTYIIIYVYYIYTYNNIGLSLRYSVPGQNHGVCS